VYLDNTMKVNCICSRMHASLYIDKAIDKVGLQRMTTSRVNPY
jgi:hypothetical protein